MNTFKTVETSGGRFQRQPALLSLPISTSLVSTVKTLSFMGCTTSQDLRWKNIITVTQQSSAEDVLPAAEEVNLPSQSGLEQPANRTRTDYSGQ